MGIISPQIHLLNFIIAIFLLLMPILSLVPTYAAFPHLAFLSDGVRILNIKHQYKLPTLELVKHIGMGFFLVFLHLFNIKS